MPIDVRGDLGAYWAVVGYKMLSGNPRRHAHDYLPTSPTSVKRTGRP